MMVTPDEQEEILRRARRAIARALEVSGGETRKGKGPAEEIHGALALPGGAFVTLRKNGELRGCIGYVESDLPIARVVEEVAVKAALHDPRFDPLSRSELAEITIEVSLLSPLKRIHSVEEIHVGEHGLLIELEGARGLLLPQVAIEYGWTRDEFLKHTARKAGLPPSAWRDENARIYIFSAQILEEHED